MKDIIKDDIEYWVYEANTDASSDCRHYNVALNKLIDIVDKDIMRVLDVLYAISTSICGRKKLFEDICDYIHPSGISSYNDNMLFQFDKMSKLEQENYVIALREHEKMIFKRFTFWEE